MYRSIAGMTSVRQIVASVQKHNDFIVRNNFRDRASIFQQSSSSADIRFFLIGTPIQSNIGDSIISEGELHFFQTYYPNIPLLEILEQEYVAAAELVKHLIRPQDVIFLQGGGNIGIDYPNEENLRRDVILNFPNNRIILFPQTIFFPDTSTGVKEELSCSQLYQHNNNLVMFAREQISFERMKSLFPHGDIRLCPDMGLGLTFPQSHQRKGVLFCLRDDLETTLSSTMRAKLLKDIQNADFSVSLMDMMHYEEIKPSHRSRIVFEKIASVSHAEVLITDRLHAMISAVITGTPCFVLPNATHKVKSFYNSWLSELSFVHLLESPDEISSQLGEWKQKQDISEFTEIVFDFTKLKECVDSICSNNGFPSQR